MKLLTAADLIEVLSNIKINPTEGGKRDMCKAWIEQKEEGRAEGLAEGRAEGRAEGIAKGRAEGIDMINTLYNRLILAGRIDDMKRAATDKEYQKKLMEEIIPDMLERLK